MNSEFIHQSFISNIKCLLGNGCNDFLLSLEKPAVTSVRLNERKPYTNEFEDIESILWCKHGVQLAKRLSFTLDPLFHCGAYYVQEAASMFVEQCANTIKTISDIDYILDLCAAPGGKSTHLASLFPNSLLVSNEIIRSRVSVLRENISKWGNNNAIVTSNDPSKFSAMEHYFDLVLVDAPCSGEGMFRKDPKSIKEWSPENVQLCAARQKRILNDVWESLKPGGFMIYSTCTYNVDENEKVVKYITESLGAQTIPVNISEFEGIAPSFEKSIDAYRFFPHKTQSEGFFISLIRKNIDTIRKSKNRKQSISVKVDGLNHWLSNNNCAFIKNNDNVHFLPEKFAPDIDFINKYLNIISSGTCICTIKGKEYIPSLEMAHSVFLNTKSFTVYNIDKQTALRFLKRETLSAPPDIPKGYVLLIYNNIPLGWVKNIGSRCNNLFPESRRIKMNIK